MRKLLIMLILTGLVLGIRWSQLTRPKTQVRPAVTAVPSSTPLPPHAIPLRAEPIEKTWPSYFAVSERSVPARDFEKDGYELTASYPKLDSAKPEAQRFNRWIRNKVLGYVRQFRTLADAEQRHKEKSPPYLWGLNLSYTVYYSNERFISLRLGHDVMEARQMHPILYYETINYDLKQGRQLRAKDIFKRGYLKAFSNYSRTYLMSHYPTENEEGVRSGTRPVVADFLSWNLVPDGVLLSFEDYQVGPHSFGQPEFVVPFSALGGTIQENVLRTLLVSQ